VDDGDAVLDAVDDAVLVLVAVALGDGVRDGDCDGLAVCEAVEEGVDDRDGDCEGDAVLEGDDDGVAVWLALPDAVEDLRRQPRCKSRGCGVLWRPGQFGRDGMVPLTVTASETGWWTGRSCVTG